MALTNMVVGNSSLEFHKTFRIDRLELDLIKDHSRWAINRGNKVLTQFSNNTHNLPSNSTQPLQVTHTTKLLLLRLKITTTPSKIITLDSHLLSSTKLATSSR